MRIQPAAHNCSADPWNLCTSFRSIQRIKADPLLHWDLWPSAMTGASDTCVARGSRGESGGGEDLTSLSTCLWSVRPQLRSRVRPLGQWCYWKLLTLATGHLTLLTLGAFLGPGPCSCSLSFRRMPGVRNGQGRTNEVRAAVLGDLCPSAAPIAFWLGDWAGSWFIRSWWMMNLYGLAMLFLYFAMLLTVLQRRG